MLTRSSTISEISQVLAGYKTHIEEKLLECVPTLGEKTVLRDACEYALMNGGKRFRPALVLMIAKALGREADATQSALAVEFFHTASLIADDLPCMDNDDERREKPSVHKAYGESIALLATYALIASGYEYLAKNAKALKQAHLPFSSYSDRICLLALENATYNTGFFGATGGQFLDIFPPDLNLATIREVIHKKTVSLFEISFMLGWLYGGGDLSKLDLVKKAASHFGMAFQIADDLVDIQQDAVNGRKVNIAAVLGKEAALQMFHEESRFFQKTLHDLRLDSQELRDILALLIYQAESA